MVGIRTDNLNPSQVKAVLHGDSPLAVIAGAGSGKTRVITHRVAHLIQRGILPSRLFVTTFTNRAADEMKERLVPMIGESRSQRLRIGTFHSLCRTILIDLLKKQSVHRFENPRLFKSGTRFFVMQGVFKRADLNEKQTKLALKEISFWKNDGLTVEEVKAKRLPFSDYYEVYENHVHTENLMDFDDMLFRTYFELIKPKNKDFLESVQQRIDHILVDEGQDLNRIQFMLTSLLSGTKRNVTLVGDDYQVLYGFRGASVHHFLQFLKDFNPEVVKLEQNYRSTNTIVGLGNRLIDHNKIQIKKTLFTENEVGDPPEVIVGYDADDEAEQVFDKIENLVVNCGYELSDICILYRTNAQSRAIVDVLVKNSIPHKVHSRFGFYDRAEIKDIITYIRIISNPYAAELEDFKRVANRPSRFLGKAFFDGAEDYQIEHEKETYWEAMKAYAKSENCTAQQSRAAQKFIDDITSLNNWAFNLKEAGNPPSTGDVIRKFLEVIPYKEWLIKEDQDEDEPDNDRKLNIDSLMVGANRFPSTEEFLFFIDAMADRSDEDEDDTVHLMTIHKSKGTEFPVIFVIGCSDKLLPHYKATDPEEERRCAYVAVTRAMEKLYLSFIHGKYSRLNVTASVFLQEMALPMPRLRLVDEGASAVVIRRPAAKVELPASLEVVPPHGS